VGTHLDCISQEKYGCGYVSDMEHLVRELVEKPRYQKKVIVPPNCIRAVSCAFGGSRAGKILPLTIKGMDWKRTLKLHNIRDTLYVEPCNFTLNPSQDSVLT
jgi:hypothetical protein